MISTADGQKNCGSCARVLYITACDDRDRQVKRGGRNRMSAGYEKPDTTINCWASSGRILSMMFLVSHKRQCSCSRRSREQLEGAWSVAQPQQHHE
jgi:hypothetical protein